MPVAARVLACGECVCDHYDVITAHVSCPLPSPAPSWSRAGDLQPQSPRCPAVGGRTARTSRSQDQLPVRQDEGIASTSHCHLRASVNQPATARPGHNKTEEMRMTDRRRGGILGTVVYGPSASSGQQSPSTSPSRLTAARRS